MFPMGFPQKKPGGSLASDSGPGDSSLSNRLNGVCESVTKKEADILAAGVIDLEKGVFLAVHHNIPQFADASRDAMAATIVRLFSGHEISRLASLHASGHGSESQDLTTGVYLSFHRVSYFMKKIESEQVTVVLITKNTINQAFGWVFLQEASLLVKQVLANDNPSADVN